MPSSESSNDTNIPAIKGENVGGGPAIVGVSSAGRAVSGWSETNYGVSGDSRTFPGVRGTSAEGRGVEGWSTSNDGVWGISKLASGVHGVSEDRGTGVVGESKLGRGVLGISESASGVYGQSKGGRAIEGWSETNYGVSGDSQTFAGVRGTSVRGTGTEGWSTDGTGVFATSQNGFGLHAKGGRLAGFFEGDVEVTGDIRLTHADCAEEFDIAENMLIEPGAVMVFDANDGGLVQCCRSYDKRVAGVISGAGDFKPGIVLDRRSSYGLRLPIALLGKVFCKVDASQEPIEAGDLLTTSETPGHAMKASHSRKAFGSVIGKALGRLQTGKGLIPILVALQ
jgi:hypothetical protein